MATGGAPGVCETVEGGADDDTGTGSDSLHTGSEPSHTGSDPLLELQAVEKWHCGLTDVGKFSYSALCAVSLRELYSDVQWNG